MNDSFAEAALRGAAFMFLFWIGYMVLRMCWRLFVRMINALPQDIDDVARRAGNVTAGLERVTSSAAAAFKEARNSARSRPKD